MNRQVISDGFGVGAEADKLRSEFINSEAPAETPITEEVIEEPKEVVEDTKDVVKEEKVVDFSSKDFEKTQQLLNINASRNSLNRELEGVKHQKASIVSQAFKDQKVVSVSSDDEFGDSDDVIQYHIDKYATLDELQKYVGGDVKNENVRNKIDEFFTNPSTGEVLELANGTEVKSEVEEYEFKRGMLLYFKQNDEYIAKIDEELKKLDEATAEFNENITEAINPLRDNLLAYVQYLFDNNQDEDGDDAETLKRKSFNRKKAKAIRSGYTLENLIETIEKRPSIKVNALKDFRDESRLRTIGERYASKLKNCNIQHNLFGLLSNDTKDSLEYRSLPKDDYPAGLEGFTVFFIIRTLSMTLPNKEDEIFHSAAQVVLTQLLEGTLDPEIAEQVRNSIKKFLSYFA